MEASLESKFSAAFEQQNASGGSHAKSQLVNGGGHSHKRSSHNNIVPSMTTATPSTESSGEKTVSFRKGNDLESFEALSSLFANGLFTDLVICCAGKMFKCHRVVLAAASLYIRDALSAFYNNAVDGNSGCNHCNTVMILPKEIKMMDMEAILRFIYDGHVEVKVDCIESFLKSARTLNIKGLSNVNIVFNNNGSSANDELAEEGEHTVPRKNNGYTKNHNLLNGHVGMNSPPPSPPSLNSSLASLKALAANQTSSATGLTNGNNHHHHHPHHGGGKHLNGLGQFRSSSHKQRDQSPLRNDHQSSSLLSHNITPAHQSSTPKSIFANGNIFTNNARLDVANSIVPPSGGSRRKQKFPTNIPPTFLNDFPPPLAAAFYNTWLNSEAEDDDEGEDSFEEKKLVIKDESSNDCSTTGDLSNASIEAARHPALGPFNVPLGTFNPQMPCMIEVEADPTNFPTYCHDLNESANLLQTANKRRRHFKSGFPAEGMFHNKKLKLPFGAANINSPGGDVSIKPSSPLMSNLNQQSPMDLLAKKHPRPSLPSEKALFSAYSTAVKTAAGSNPALSPSSGSSVPGSWAGNKWKCDICNKYYGNKQTLKEHMDYFHSNREEQIYICNICNKEYTWRKSLMKHYRDIHQMRNTPALAEINRQLAQLATVKGQRPPNLGNSPSMPSPLSSDSSALQSYVSIANSMERKPASKDDSAKSDADFYADENDNENEHEHENENVDAVPEEEDDGDDSNEEVEIEASSSPNAADSHEEAANGSVNGELKDDSSLKEETPATNGTTELSDSSSNVVADNSPSPSPPSSLEQA